MESILSASETFCSTYHVEIWTAWSLCLVGALLWLLRNIIEVRKMRSSNNAARKRNLRSHLAVSHHINRMTLAECRELNEKRQPKLKG